MLYDGSPFGAGAYSDKHAAAPTHLLEEKFYDSSYDQAWRNRACVRVGAGFFARRIYVAPTRRRVAHCIVGCTGSERSIRGTDDGAEVQKHSGAERGARNPNAPDDELHQRRAGCELRVLPRQKRRPVGV